MTGSINWQNLPEAAATADGMDLECTVLVSSVPDASERWQLMAGKAARLSTPNETHTTVEATYGLCRYGRSYGGPCSPMARYDPHIPREPVSIRPEVELLMQFLIRWLLSTRKHHVQWQFSTRFFLGFCRVVSTTRSTMDAARRHEPCTANVYKTIELL